MKWGSIRENKQGRFLFAQVKWVWKHKKWGSIYETRWVMQAHTFTTYKSNERFVYCAEQGFGEFGADGMLGVGVSGVALSMDFASW